MSINCLQYTLFVWLMWNKSTNICFVFLCGNRSTKMQGPAPEQKMFRDRTGTTLFRAGTVPIPVPVLSLEPYIVILPRSHYSMCANLAWNALKRLCCYFHSLWRCFHLQTFNGKPTTLDKLTTIATDFKLYHLQIKLSSFYRSVLFLLHHRLSMADNKHTAAAHSASAMFISTGSDIRVFHGAVT